jgi:predicted metalloendopeptidase
VLGNALLSQFVLAFMTGITSWTPSVTPGGAPDIEAGVDASVRPGDDFFAYANGAWLKSTKIPAGKERWNARTEIDERTHQQIALLFEGLDAEPVGSAARKLADYRAAYLNEAAIEAAATAPIAPVLKRIDDIRDKAALTRLLGSLLRADVDPLNWGVFDSSHVLGLAVEPGLHGEKTYGAFLLQGGLGLPDREHYVSNEPRMRAMRSRYQAYIARVLMLAGFGHSAQRAEAVMALESALAKTHATHEESADEKNADRLWSRGDFSRQAPGMDWRAFFEAAGLSKQEAFVVWQPQAVNGVAALVESQPLPAWLDYLRFHVIDRHADVLPHAFAAEAFALHGIEVAGLHQQSPRAQRAMEAVQQAMGGALGRLYVERYFPPELKARVQTITANVISAFRRHVETVTWMSPASKAQALAKLQRLYFGVGYPEQWPDYSSLTVSPTDAVGNLQRASEWNYRNALARLGQPVDKRDWIVAPHTVIAVLTFQQNAYNFPASLLQAPKFDATASDAANYGAIGAIVGHETSHFVDTLGADYDAEGRKVHWWTPEDAAHFDAAAEPLVKQFGSYRPFADLAINGKATRTENVADLAGLTAAFEAYRRALGARANDKSYVRQQDRQFFLGFARSWRSKIRADALRTQVATNDHAPESYRIATVRNLDAWYDAFDVRPGQRLYLDPKARVRVW